MAVYNIQTFKCMSNFPSTKLNSPLYMDNFCLVHVYANMVFVSKKKNDFQQNIDEREQIKKKLRM